MSVSGRKEERRAFFACVVPSVLGFALSGIYTIVDGFFVGRSMGDNGIAAVTIGFPVAQFIQSLGTGIGVSGSVRYTLFSSEGRQKEKEASFSGALLLMVLVSAVLTILLLFFSDSIISLMGAKGTVHRMAVEYIRVIAVGTAFQLLGTGLVPFIRNMGGATFAMISMILGFGTNILLDYVFVWVLGTGMAGAAWATVIAQGVTALCAVLFFLYRKVPLRRASVSWILKLWRHIIPVSISPFGLSFSSQFTLMFMNRFLLLYGNETDVSAYGCIDYILSIVYFLIQGVGDGSQPLISKSFGENNKSALQHLRGLAYLSAEAITCASMAIVFAMRSRIGLLFGASEAANAEVIRYLPWFLAALMFLCFTRITTSCLYATEKAALSYILVYGEPLMTILLLIVLPLWWGIGGVWLSIPAAQIIACGAAVIVRHKSA